jgi:hypothetical protein
LSIFAAIRLASSFVSTSAADRRPGSCRKDVGKLLPIVIAHNETGILFFDRPGRREAAGGQNLPDGFCDLRHIQISHLRANL